MKNGHAIALRRREVVAWLTEGKPVQEIASELGISYQAVYQWRQGHAAELAKVSAKLDRKAEQYAIAHVVNRVAALDSDHQRLGQVIVARATDPRYQKEPGYSTGLMAHSLKTIGSGDNSMVVDEYKVDVAVVAERRALIEAAADQLGQKPRPPVLVVNNDNRKYVLRWDDGTPA